MNKNIRKLIISKYFKIFAKKFKAKAPPLVKCRLKKGDEVRLVGFGTFTVAKRAATTGRNLVIGLARAARRRLRRSAAVIEVAAICSDSSVR